MSVPDVNLTIKDGALGLAAVGDGQRVQLKIGTCQSGTVRVVQSFSDIKAMYAALGDGPLTEAAALVLQEAGGPVLCMRATGTTAGATGSASATQTGTATLTPTGAAYDSYDAIVTIVKGGATLVAGTATFTYSLDGGKSVSAEIAVPTGGVYVIPNTNVTLTWTYTSGTAFVAGDKWTFATTAPGFDTTELATCMTAALADSAQWSMVHVVGPASTAAGAESVVAAMDTNLGTAANAYRFAFAAVEFPADTDSNLNAAATGASTRVMRCAGFENAISPLNGRQQSRSVAWKAMARMSKIPPSEDLGRVATGPVPGVVSVSRDERVTNNLDPKFCTMRTFIGLPGFWFTSGRLAASPGSDFGLVQYRRVMDLACTVAHAALLQYVNSSVRVNSSNGRILETDARVIEQGVKAQLQAALLQPATADGPGYASDVSVLIDRTANILSTQTLPVQIRVIPRGYARTISVDIGFTNPALQSLAA